MGEVYTVVTQRDDTLFLGGTQTTEVVRVGATSTANGTYIEFTIPKKIYSAAQLNAYALGFIATVDAMWTIPNVVGVSWGQVPTASGELDQALTIYASSSSGNSTLSVTVAPALWSKERTAPLVAALVTQMDNAEAA